MKTFIKILTFPIWFPIKVLWMISKVLAFIFVLAVVAALVYVFVILQ